MALSLEWTNVHCCDCNDLLTLDELEYYIYRCEACEWKWHEAIERWRLEGGPRPHEATPYCWCEPTQDAKEPTLWLHNQLH